MKTNSNIAFSEDAHTELNTKLLSTVKHRQLLTLSCSEKRQSCFMQHGRMDHRLSSAHRLGLIVQGSNLGYPDRGSPSIALSVL